MVAKQHAIWVSRSLW